MAWVGFTTAETIGDAYSNYGTVQLQYDSSTTGTNRLCRLHFELDPGSSIYIYFNDITVDGTNHGQTLVSGTMDVWSGYLSAGQSHSYSFSCPWYTGTSYYGKSGTLPSAYTAPTTPTISATVSGASITVTYGTTSYGNPSTGTTTLYGGTSSAPTTSLDTTTSTGNKTFTHTGLTPGTTYYYRARANNGQLSSAYSTEISVTVPINHALYGSVNGQAEKVEKLYGPLKYMSGAASASVTTCPDYPTASASVSGIVTSNLVDAVNGNDLLIESLRAAPLQSILVDYIVTKPSSAWTVDIKIRALDQSILQEVIYNGLNEAGVSSRLLTWGGIPVSSSASPRASRAIISGITYTTLSKKILKLYGSEGGLSKLIYSE